MAEITLSVCIRGSTKAISGIVFNFFPMICASGREYRGWVGKNL